MECCKHCRIGSQLSSAEEEISSTVKILTGLLILISVALIIIDVVALVELKNDSENYDPFGIKIPALCGMIILYTHFNITLVHLFAAVSLYSTVEDKDFIKCRQWCSKSIPLMCMESLNVVIFLFLSPTLYYFVALANLGIVFKLYMLWPMKRFIISIRKYTVSLALDRKLLY